MDKNIVQVLTIVLVGTSLVLTFLGGYIDMKDRAGKPLYISKEHAWSDGIFLLLLAILLNVLA